MRTILLLALTFGLAGGIHAQTNTPDTTLDSLTQPKADTVIVQGTDTASIKTDTAASDKKTSLRSPTGALLRSLAIPGWGQVYNKKYFKAIIVAGGQGTLLGTAIVEWKRATDAKKNLDLEDYRIHTNNRNMLLWLYAAATVVSMLDAYVDAHLSQDTGEGVPKIGVIGLEPDFNNNSLLIKLKINL